MVNWIRKPVTDHYFELYYGACYHIHEYDMVYQDTFLYDKPVNCIIIVLSTFCKLPSCCVGGITYCMDGNIDGIIYGKSVP